eukprot:CAMPEP_0183325498 /NCGR_PEP_ID=MMETSP0160_2-20130417/79721_1 /TAXON_ID=2839 ORGANISM="Odontella Sinensis, Strain Grunow 1884" /NCGR_SAMPLE_ID=MMETSP0160_2 /ASSEMBLY_ACC=CAM_ASM_000250 /LENGTH=149 /DNA_ID=CAMNT_0025493291 /DNA_START=101 /DNA_END=550 /DNA_ORIENTATION=-
MAVVVRLNPNWFSGFTGISAAVPGQETSSLVWLDSFTVPIYPFKIEVENKPEVDFVSRVSSLGEDDTNVPVAYVEFRRIKNPWENKEPKMETVAFFSVVGVVVLVGVTILLFNAGVQLKRKFDGYQSVSENSTKLSGVITPLQSGEIKV